MAFFAVKVSILGAKEGKSGQFCSLKNGSFKIYVLYLKAFTGI
jgi:hypothetical protein